MTRHCRARALMHRALEGEEKKIQSSLVPPTLFPVDGGGGVVSHTRMVLPSLTADSMPVRQVRSAGRLPFFYRVRSSSDPARGSSISVSACRGFRRVSGTFARLASREYENIFLAFNEEDRDALIADLPRHRGIFRKFRVVVVAAARNGSRDHRFTWFAGRA